MKYYVLTLMMLGMVPLQAQQVSNFDREIHNNHHFNEADDTENDSKK
ncbi:MAG: hypothetical protein ACRCTQ_03945 [Brevinemataceae bacterium]